MKKKKEIKYFDDHEVIRFFDTLKKEGNVRDHLFFLLMFRYGLRVREGVSLKLSDIKPNPAHPVEVNIIRAKDGISRHYPIKVEDGKVLKKWLKNRGTFQNAIGNDYLFITARSLIGPMSIILAQKLHEKYCQKAGLPKEKTTNIHAWRHSCAISLLMRGKDIYYVRNHLGHNSLQSTMGYLEVAPPQWSQLAKEAIESGFVVEY